MAWTFEAELWLWREDRPDAWIFVDLPAEVSEEVRELSGPRRGFGSVPVAVRIGGSSWRTSVFPGSETYVLPVKKAVRRAEGLDVGDVATVTLELA
ncbi:DUF1905 domain-containing protein [Nocardioides fonticola]|uniref:DUF1905 domain-containing protein n=1 Tax=Nocardioides fonticola TaxID=450363 RepID=A0ABP7XA10_9ACTN